MAFDWQDVHDFWFPPSLKRADVPELKRMAVWWMAGGATPHLQRFRPVVDAARAGRLDGWRDPPAARVSLIVVLDQFTRGLFAGTPAAFGSDQIALSISEEGLRQGEYSELSLMGEQSFFLMPLLHTEGPGHLERVERVLAFAQARVLAAPSHLRPAFEFGVSQAKGHRDVIARFGRFPHRNEILGRPSTADEMEYLRDGDFVHERVKSWANAGEKREVGWDL